MDNIYRTLFNVWQKKLPVIVQRDSPLDAYAGMMPRKIIAVTGLRRIGKTYMLFQLAGSNRNRILYVNFDDERVPRRTEFLTGLMPAAINILGERPSTLFLDELQVMPDWSRWLRRIYDEGEMEIFVTGSSSEISSEEIPSELRGRSLDVRIHPLSYAEFLRFKETGPSTVLLEEYLRYGGMPEVVLANESRKFEILLQYYASVVRRDIVERFRVRETEVLRATLQLLVNSTQYTITKLHNTLRSMGHDVGKNTIARYVSHVEGAYFLRYVSVFSYKVKDQMKYARKVYFTDTGFIGALTSGEQYGRVCENVVANHLFRLVGQVYYWKDRTGKEVDFVVKDRNRVTMLVQSCWDAWNPDTVDRETSALLKASAELACDNLLVVTRDRAGVEERHGKKIRFVQLGEWLLENEV